MYGVTLNIYTHIDMCGHVMKEYFSNKVVLLYYQYCSDLYILNHIHTILIKLNNDLSI